MNERRLVLLGYGFVLGVVSVSICQAYPANQVVALCLVVISASIASTVTIVLAELLWAPERR